MVNSKDKGVRGELAAREQLNKLTNLKWERIPLSGALSEKHLLKGDLYVPGTNILFCVEVKSYKEDHISTKLLTSKCPQFNSWWDQTVREANQINKEPLLLFKHNRSKWFAAIELVDVTLRIEHGYDNYFTYKHNNYDFPIYIMLLSDLNKYIDWVIE